MLKVSAKQLQALLDKISYPASFYEEITKFSRNRFLKISKWITIQSRRQTYGSQASSGPQGTRFEPLTFRPKYGPRYRNNGTMWPADENSCPPLKYSNSKYMVQDNNNPFVITVNTCFWTAIFRLSLDFAVTVTIITNTIALSIVPHNLQ